MVKSIKPGEAVITASINGGMKLQTRIYVNVDIPASFEKTLRIAGYLPASGDTILPSQLETIRTLDFRSFPTTLAIDLSGIQKLPNLNALYLKGTKLSTDTLNLYNSPYLTYVDASDTNIKSVTNVPKGIKTFIATNNVLTSFSFLGSTSVEVVNLANNSISSYTAMTYATDVNLLNNKLTSLSISSERLQKLNVSSNYISSVNINSSTLKNLDLSSNQLWYNNLNLNSNATSRRLTWKS